MASLFAGFGAAALAAYFGGSFVVPFYISAVLCGIAALCALLLRPLVRARISKEVSMSKEVPIIKKEPEPLKAKAKSAGA
jgi:hypothetical protein